MLLNILVLFTFILAAALSFLTLEDSRLRLIRARQNGPPMRRRQKEGLAMKATLDQAGKLIELFKGVPGEQLQDLFASGLLTDLRDGNIAKVNRDAFRRMLDLKPLVPMITIYIDPTKRSYIDMPEGKLDSDIEYPAGEVKLQLGEFLRPGERWIKGREMMKRSGEIRPSAGRKHAEAVLENQHLIPEEWKRFSLVFLGLAWRDSAGHLYVIYLIWSEGQKKWVGGFCRDSWLEHGWGSNAHIVEPRK